MENKRQIYEKLIKEKNNPYGLNWINKIFKKNNNEKIELSKKQFKNGVPIIKLLGKKDMNKRDIVTLVYLLLVIQNIAVIKAMISL